LGFAYQLNTQREKELMLRAGLGLFYDLGTGQSAQGFGSVFPFVSAKRFFAVAFPLTPGQAEPPPLSLSPPYGPIVAFDPDRVQVRRDDANDETLARRGRFELT
jgi:hypothetical protein